MNRNVLFSLINQIILVLVPFITFPYLSRILGPEYYGKLNYLTNISLMFGIIYASGSYAFSVRTYSNALKDEKEARNVKKDLFVFNFLTACLGFMGSVVFLNLSTEFSQQEIFLASLTIITVALSSLWIIVGDENFKFITIRNLITKIVSLVGIILLIREPENYYYYFIINILIDFALFVLTFRILNLGNFKKISYEKVIMYFRYSSTTLQNVLISSLGNQTNIIILNMLLTFSAISFFTVATKIPLMIITIINGFLLANSPRMYKMISEEDYKGIFKIIKLNLKFILFISLPVIIVVQFESEEILEIIAGSEYIIAAEYLRYSIYLLLLVPVTAVLYQIVYSAKLELESRRIIIEALIISIVCNYIFISWLGIMGAILTSLVLELYKLIRYLIIISKKSLLRLGDYSLKNEFSDFLWINLIFTLIILFFKDFFNIWFYYSILSFSMFVYYGKMLWRLKNG
ncbi:lipopolysaccharide biosynthesis protein [Exiguobacterium sp. s7]|uniref:lipopolysaccharide biosynthesis protein n=1 Tax=Exiguobacterium sp. s7 TaxID=2751235 RepID=UPI001BE8E797|nr:oligosaccharide flippase family protein [Exiguobacterium sp. s7]